MHTAIVLLTTGVLVAPLSEVAKESELAPVVNTIDLASIEQVAIDPPAITLDDPRSKQRLLVTATQGSRLVDVSDLATVQSSDEKVVALNDRLEAVPRGDGKAEIVIKIGNFEVKAPVTVTNSERGRPINFANEIVPIFTKRTCNSGGCHGKSGGQNGFALSLLGFEPDGDYAALVKEARGRRLVPAAPQQSLLLRKATGQTPHGGGRLLHAHDDDYDLIVRWVAQGTPYGRADDPTVTKIDVFPSQRVMQRRGAQRLRVTATYSDGRTEDVTRHVQFQSNNDAVATVDESGKVTTTDASGEPAIMARYLGQVDVFRAAVPVGLPIENPPDFQPRHFVDELTSKKWEALGLVPAERADDSTFIRRVYVDLCGKLPAPAVVRQFLDSGETDKRERLIDDLLESTDYAAYMAMKWGAILQNKRGTQNDFAYGTHAMSLWLKNAFANDLPYDKFVSAVLTATGTPEINPPVVWYRQVRTNEDNVDNVAQLFLGTRLQCARCHHHPFEKWSQDDYWGVAAFFGRLGRKKYDMLPGGQTNEAIYVRRSGSVNNPKTGQPAPPHGLDGPVVEIAAGDDPRQKLAEWMTAPENKLFAQALVNRLWGHFFDRGIVDPIDDMRVTNPPTNPELLDALADDFVKHEFSIKHTIRMICSSATYQLSSVPNKYNQGDQSNFARYYPKRLAAEVLLDALDQVTGVPTGFGYPKSMGAVDLPDERVNSYFLDIFGRPQRSSSCECERTMDANISQALHLLNSGEIQGKLTSGSGYANALAADQRPHEEIVAELFLTAFARKPTDDELQTALEHIRSKDDKKIAYQNLIWALINTKEFQFNT